MRRSNGLQERSAASTSDLTLNSFSNEATPIPLELIDFLEEFRRQRDRDSLAGRHRPEYDIKYDHTQQTAHSRWNRENTLDGWML